MVVAQLGCGYWGPNLLRVLHAQQGCHVKWVAEIDPQRRNYVESNFPLTRTTADWETVLGDLEIEAVLIATPASTHYELARKALEAGKHVFVEKPLAMSTLEATHLVNLANARRATLMVGHTFLYNPAVRYLKYLVKGGELGKLYYLYSHRLNLGQVRSDVNVWWNLGPHDVSIFLYLMNGRLPDRISAQGFDFLQRKIEDVAFLTLTWEGLVAAHIHLSWLDPKKVRTITLVGSQKMVSYDDGVKDKITIFNKGVDRVPVAGEKMDYDQPYKFKIVHRAGDVITPRIDAEEPLTVEIAHFFQCIFTGETPLTGPQHAKDVVTILEAGEEALSTGKTVTVAPRLAQAA